MFNFDPNAARQKNAKGARTKAHCGSIKAWVQAELEEKLPGRDLAPVHVEVSEVQCGDPNCNPIDVLIRLWFPHIEKTFMVNKEAADVEQGDVAAALPPAEHLQAWFDGRDPFFPGLQVPRLDPRLNNALTADADADSRPALRFAVGARVECLVGRGTWAEGTVLAHWYKQKNFPAGRSAPYQVRLEEEGKLIYVPQDVDAVICHLDPSNPRSRFNPPPPDLPPQCHQQ